MACANRRMLHRMLQLHVLCLGESGARCESERLHPRWEDVDLDEPSGLSCLRRRTDMISVIGA